MNEEHQWKVQLAPKDLGSFNLYDRALGFHSRPQKLEPPYTLIQHNIQYCSVAFI